MKSEPFTKAVPGFDDPLGLLEACHLRIGQRCALLKRIADHLAQHGADTQVRQSCMHVLRYFDDAGPKHHADEEQDFFPLLLAATPAARRKLQAVLDELVAQHRAMDATWDRLRPMLIGIEAGHTSAIDENLVDQFHTLNLTHIAIEERDVLAVARERLTPEALEQLGRRMAERRNVEYPGGSKCSTR
jgi:hypothetical protein